MQLFPSALGVALALVTALFCSGLAAQASNGLDDLVAEHKKRLKAIEMADPYKPEDFEKELQAHAARLGTFLARSKDPGQRFRGRLLLTDALLTQGKRTNAAKALQGLDHEKLTAMQLLEAARWATRLRLKESRRAWIDAALQKKSSFKDRMEMARLLMTELQEVERGEAIFTAELKAQKDDEGRATVMWYQTRATRDREDLPEGAYGKALQKLADTYPKTRYGSIAKDRLAAFELKPGADPIPFTLESLDGKKRKHTDYRGKVLFLYFWSSTSRNNESLVQLLKKLRDKHGAKELALLGISLDKTRATLDKSMAALKIDWPQVFAGGPDSDIALRYKAESPPHLVLIGKNGKVAGLNFYVFDHYGQSELEQAVKVAVTGRK